MKRIRPQVYTNTPESKLMVSGVLSATSTLKKTSYFRMKMGIFIFVVISSMLISSCTLNTDPEDFIAAQNYYSNESQCDLGLTAIYDKMNYQFAALIGISFDTADEMWAYGVTNTWTNAFYSSDSEVAAFWQILYDGIERANMLLVNIDNVQMDEAKKNAIKGQSKFLRAFYYFMLVQNWGDVPFRVKPTESASDIYYPRTPASEIYDFIYNEMVEAEGLVRPITDYAYAERVSKSAVQGILARVCLYMAGFPNNKTEKYKDALMWAEKVIQSGVHSLNPSYSQVFINLIQDKYDTKESIWEIGFKATSVSDPYYEFGEIGNLNGISQSFVEYGMASGSFNAYWSLLWKYDPSDTRRDWAIAPFSYKSNSNPPEKIYFDNTLVYSQRNIGKYRREYELTPAASKQKRANPTNWPLLRYSDVLLMAAEAENEINGPTAKALEYLNMVRSRAQAPLFSGIASKEAFRTILQDERSRELCFEGLRKQDLKRWGILIPTMKALAVYVRQTSLNSTVTGRACLPLDNVSEKHFYYPIPLREINLNKLLTQNPGW